jgi:hypothetical protein
MRCPTTIADETTFFNNIWIHSSTKLFRFFLESKAFHKKAKPDSKLVNKIASNAKSSAKQRTALKVFGTTLILVHGTLVRV